MVEKKIDFRYVSPVPLKKETTSPFTHDTNTERKIMDTSPLEDLPIAMAYVPMQKWRRLYESEVGFERGTIFQELDLPFLGEELPR